LLVVQLCNKNLIVWYINHHLVHPVTREPPLNLRNSPPEISHTLIGGWCMRSCFADYV
jgi:hypothetical protein